MGFTGWGVIGFNDITLTSVGFCLVRYTSNEFGSMHLLILKALKFFARACIAVNIKDMESS